MKRFTSSPALVLLFLAPILGELVSGHQAPLGFFNPLSFLITALPYGFGAILCRELVVRWKKGWAALGLLAVAYGLYEEAIVARSIWDPNWAELGPIGDYTYWGGLSWTYAEALLHFHLVVSILSSVLLAELLFPQRRHEPWVGRRGLLACGLGLAFWMLPLMVFNPFMPPLLDFALAWLAIAALVYAAYRLPAEPLPGRTGAPVSPLRVGVLAAANTFIVVIVLLILPGSAPAWLPPWPLTFVFIALVELVTLALLLRWSGPGCGWGDRHRLMLAAGFLAFFIAFGFLQDLVDGFQGYSLVSLAAIWGLWALWRRINRRLPT